MIKTLVNEITSQKAVVKTLFKIIQIEEQKETKLRTELRKES